MSICILQLYNLLRYDVKTEFFQTLEARLTLALPARGRSIEGYRAVDIVGGLCDAVEGSSLRLSSLCMFTIICSLIRIMNMVTKKTGMTLISYDFQSSWFVCMENDFNEELDIPPLVMRCSLRECLRFRCLEETYWSRGGSGQFNQSNWVVGWVSEMQSWSHMMKIRKRIRKRNCPIYPWLIWWKSCHTEAQHDEASGKKNWTHWTPWKKMMSYS